MKRSPQLTRSEARRRLRAVQKQIAGLEYLCSGTVSYQTRRCGKPNCACAADPAARHGPYYVWSRREGGRQVNTMLAAEVGPRFERAAGNYRKLRDLLHRWERLSAAVLLPPTGPKSQPRRHLASKRKRGPQRSRP